MEKYRALLRDVAQIVIGEVVDEDDDFVTLKNPAIVAVQGGQGGQLNIQFVPLELVSMQPPISIKVLLEPKEGEDDAFSIRFRKSELLKDDLQLTEQIYNGYDDAVNPKQVEVPPNPGGLVGPDGAPLAEDQTPVVQPLFK